MITGAGSGIGLALAREFAKNNHPLILTSRLAEDLQRVAAELRHEHGAEVQTFAADLERPEAVRALFGAAQEEPPDILVNDAGLGYRGRFWEIPLENQLSIIRVNIEAVTRLTYLFLPQMIQNNRGGVLNVASVAGFEPGPLLAVYHASKAYVLSFTEALATELQETELKVSALCPGPTDTDFFPKAGMENTKAFQKGHVMSPQEVAEIGYASFMKGNRTIVTGGMNKTMVFLRRFMSEGGQAKKMGKYYEEVEPAERTRHRGDVELKKAA